MYFIDVKYLLLISSRLRNFKQKNDNLWNCSCPLCGDSATNVRKARLYFFRHKGDLMCKCHNCSSSSSFGFFLKGFDVTTHRDYAFEKYTNNGQPQFVYKSDEHKFVDDKPLGPIRGEYELSIPSILELAEGHPAKAYIASRKIPDRFWGELYFADSYKTFLDRDFPGRASEDVLNDQRIVLPFINPDNYITYTTGRSLAAYGKHDIRYITVKILEHKKIFGENRLSENKNSPVYVTEGPIDSLFLPNAVASGDANLLGVAQYLRDKDYTNVISVYDCEPRNLAIIKQMEKTIDAGFSIVIQPYGNNKDLNMMAMEGWSDEKIYTYIAKHTYQGMNASLEFSRWRIR